MGSKTLLHQNPQILRFLIEKLQTAPLVSLMLTLLLSGTYAESPKGLKVGDRVKVDVSTERLEVLQKERDAWDPELAKVGSAISRACLDQLLIAIRSFTVLCDQNRSEARLIAIMKLIANLGIIYATACHANLCTTALDCLSVSCHCRRTALTTIYKHGTGRGRWGLGRQLQQQLALWVRLK